MTDLNLHSDDLSPYFQRAHIERARAVTGLARATGRAIKGWAAATAAAYSRRQTRLKTVHELQSLSDRTLRDIGISRGAIWSVAEDLVNGAAGIGEPHQQRQRPRLVSSAPEVAPAATPVAVSVVASVAAPRHRPSRAPALTQALAGCN